MENKSVPEDVCAEISGKNLSSSEEEGEAGRDLPGRGTAWERRGGGSESRLYGGKCTIETGSGVTGKNRPGAAVPKQSIYFVFTGAISQGQVRSKAFSRGPSNAFTEALRGHMSSWKYHEV